MEKPRLTIEQNKTNVPQMCIFIKSTLEPNNHYLKNKSWEKNVHRLWQECQITMATRFCMVVSNIWGSSAWNLLHITLLAPRILRWLLEFGKICAPLADNIYVNFNLN